jgi:hypothetical protein
MNLCGVLQFTAISDVGFMRKLKRNNWLQYFMAYMLCFASSLLLPLHNKLTTICDLDLQSAIVEVLLCFPENRQQYIDNYQKKHQNLILWH